MKVNEPGRSKLGQGGKNRVNGRNIHKISYFDYSRLFKGKILVSSVLLPLAGIIFLALILTFPVHSPSFFPLQILSPRLFNCVVVSSVFSAMEGNYFPASTVPH